MWDILKSFLPNISLNPVSDRRWPSRTDAVKPLRYHLGDIYDRLVEISEVDNDIAVRQKDICLAKKIVTFKFLCSILIWNDIISKINCVSKLLQDPNLDLAESIEIIENVQSFLNKKQ